MAFNKCPIMIIHEYCQKSGLKPEISTYKIGGTDHMPVFRCSYKLPNLAASAEAGNKKEAQRRAAQQICDRLQLSKTVSPPLIPSVQPQQFRLCVGNGTNYQLLNRPRSDRPAFSSRLSVPYGQYMNEAGSLPFARLNEADTSLNGQLKPNIHMETSFDENTNAFISGDTEPTTLLDLSVRGTNPQSNDGPRSPDTSSLPDENGNHVSNIPNPLPFSDKSGPAYEKDCQRTIDLLALGPKPDGAKSCQSKSSNRTSQDPGKYIDAAYESVRSIISNLKDLLNRQMNSNESLLSVVKQTLKEKSIISMVNSTIEGDTFKSTIQLFFNGRIVMTHVGKSNVKESEAERQAVRHILLALLAPYILDTSQLPNFSDESTSAESSSASD